jgi:predicted CXXCH cytochrome family protein
LRRRGYNTKKNALTIKENDYICRKYSRYGGVIALPEIKVSYTFKLFKLLFSIFAVCLLFFLSPGTGTAATPGPTFPHSCRNCHSALHDIRVLPREGAWATCFTCHDGTGSIFNVRAQYTRPVTHPPGLNLARFDLASMRCIDCHDPHATQSTEVAAQFGSRFSWRKLGSLLPGVTAPPGSSRIAAGNAFCYVCHLNDSAPAGMQRLRVADGVYRRMLAGFERTWHNLGLAPLLPPRSNIICQHCHEAHGSDRSYLQIQGRKYRGQCLSCHSDTRLFGGSTRSPLDNVYGDRFLVLLGGQEMSYFFAGLSRWQSLELAGGADPVPPPPPAPATVGDGGAMVFDGRNVLYVLRGGGTSTFWRYEIAEARWTVLRSAPSGVSGGGGLAWTGDDFIYAFRGGGDRDFWRYRISTNSWTSMASAPDDVRYGGSLVWTGGDFIYAFRGDGSTSFWRYRISTNSWTSMASAPGDVRSGGSLTWAGGDFIYAFRGDSSTSFWRYQISTNSWTSMASAPGTVGAGGSLTSVSDFIYAFRGNSTTDFWSYRISTNTWTALVAAPAAVGAGGSLAVTGGNSVFALRGGGTTDFWRYDIPGNRWPQHAIIPGPTGDGAAIAYAGADFSYILRGGGTSEFWRYNIRTHTFGTMAAAPGAVGTGGSLVYARSPSDFRDYIFAFQGGTTAFWRYDISANSWTAMAAAPAAVGAGASLVWAQGDFIYAFRGGGTTAFWRYQISTNTWNPNRGSSPAITGGVPAPAPGAVGAGGNLVCISGDFIYALRGGGTTDFWRYQISANTWNPVPGASPAITGGVPAPAPGAVGAGGSLVNVGGSFIYALRGGGTTDVWHYDVARNLWTPNASAPRPIVAGAAMGSTSFAYMHPVDSIPPTRVGRPGWTARTMLSSGVMLCSDCHDVHSSLPGSSFPESPRVRGSLRGVRGVEPAPWPFPASQPRSIPTPIPGAGVTLTGAALPARLFAVAGGGSNRFYGFDLRDDTRRELRPVPVAVPNGSPLVWDGGGDRLYLLVHGTPGTFLSYSINSGAWTTLASPGNTGAGASLVWGGGDFLYSFLGGGTAFRRFNVSTGAWADLAAAPAAVAAGASLVHTGGDFIYAFQGGTSAFWRYQISTNAWNPNPGHSPAITGGVPAAAPALIPAGSSLAFPRGGFHLYASLGGSGALLQYDITANTWTAPAAAPDSFGAGAGIIWGGGDFLWVTRGGGTGTFRRYSQVRNVWETMAALPAPGVAGGGALVYAGGNFIYAFRGGGSATFARYSQGTVAGGTLNTWADVAAPPAAPGAGASLVWTENDDIFAFQGGTNAFWRYRVSTNSWSVMAPAPAAVGDGASLVYPMSGDYIYAFRGGGTTDFWRYKISTNTWNQSPGDSPLITGGVPAAAPAAVGSGAALAYPGEGTALYALRGGGSSDLWRYCIVYNTWAALADSPLPPAAPVTFGTGSALAFGGGGMLYALQGGSTNIWRFSVHANSWSAVGALPERQAFGGGGSLAAVDEPIFYAFPGGGNILTRYRPLTNRWLAAGFATTPASIANGAAMAWTPGGDLFAFQGGTTAFWRYNFYPNTWVTRATAPAATGAGASLVWAGEDRLFAFQGGTTAFWRYNISANTWTALAAAPAAVGAGASLVYPGFGDFIYAFRGANTTTFWRYQISTNTWNPNPGHSPAITGGVPAAAPAAVDAGGSLYYPGFGDFIYALRGAGTNALWRYSISTNTWVLLTTPLPPAAPAAVGAGGSLAWAGGDYLYAFRGGGTSDFWRYQLSTRTWNPNPGHSPAITGGVPAAAPGTVSAGGSLAWGGCDFLFAFQGGSTAFWRYQLSTNTWTALAAAPAVTGAGARIIYPGRGDFLYATRGGVTNAFWRYQLSTNTWTTMTSVPVNVTDGGSMTADGRFFIYLSVGGGTAYYRYDTSTDTWTAALSGTPATAVGAGGAIAITQEDSFYILHGGGTAFSRYDMRGGSGTGQSATLAAAPFTVGSGGALAWSGGNSLYALQGGGTTGFREFRITSNTWNETGAPDGIGTNSGNRLASAGNQLFVLRGATNREMWRYDIARNRWNSATGLGDSNAPAAYRELFVDYEYQLCLKCHSTFDQSRPPGQQDVAAFMGFGHASAHPVMAPNENRFADVETMLPPWNQQENSNVHPASRRHDLLDCGSCHTSHRNARPGYQAQMPDPVGPHGSNIRGMLRDRLETRSGETFFCTECHRRDVYVTTPGTFGERGTRFSDHRPRESDHSTANGCLDCHVGGGMRRANGRPPAFLPYVHGASIPQRTAQADGAGPTVSFLFGDGHRWVEQHNLNCFTEGTCGTDHTPRLPKATPPLP